MNEREREEEDFQAKWPVSGAKRMQTAEREETNCIDQDAKAKLDSNLLQKKCGGLKFLSLSVSLSPKV